MPHRLIVLRHGRTAWNAERRFQGQADPPLDDTGRAQAYEVAALLAALKPEIIVSSDLRRAAQTAQPLATISGLDLLPDARLRERSLGHWEGLTRDEVERTYPDEFADWVAGRDISRRGGESRHEVARRARRCVDELPDVDTAVLVTHSATAMALSCELLGLDQHVHVLGPLANCHWSELVYEPEDHAGRHWRLRSHNVGVPGTVIPLAVRPAEDEAPDADA
ncbi:MAG: histidine phosphatase family protein [Actinobacteria bacterium]|nr:histidine phosphatase family protein [Actinomycetota bacterium]